MSEKVFNAFTISAGGKIGLAISNKLKRKIEAAVITLLIENKDECIAYDWTLNDTYIEDGKQICINYPDECWYPIDKRIEDFFGFDSLMLNKNLFTECEDRDHVVELCRKVALGEIVPVERDA